LADGDHSGALAAYGDVLATMRKLTVASPGNLQWRLDVISALTKIADVRLAAGESTVALAVALEALGLTRKLAVTNPNNAQLRHEASQRLIKIGDTQYAGGDWKSALTAYEENVAVRRELATAGPSNVGWQIELAFALFKVATVVDATRARGLMVEATEILKKLERENKLPESARDWPQRFRGALAKLPPEQAKNR
jgi:hypothetical protein